MRIVLDENLPRPLRRFFGPGHQVATVQELGLAGMSNGALLTRLEGHFDVFITADKNLRYQQNLTGGLWPSLSFRPIGCPSSRGSLRRSCQPLRR